MVSQTEKWEARRKKTEELQKQGRNFGGSKKPAMVDMWDEKLKASDEYKKALLLGVNMDGFSADSQEKFDAQIELLKKKIEEIEQAPEQQEKQPEQEEQKSEQEKQPEQEEQKSEQEKQPEQQEEKPQEAQKKETLKVENIEKTDEKEPISDNLVWISEKRAFYTEYAKQNDVSFNNDEQKDLAERNFTFSFEKNDKSLGEIKYVSPTSVKISKDSGLLMYKALITDAIQNNLAISFGKTLNDTQKAMLLGAVLLNDKKTYADGSDIELHNAPKIDVNAEYFKTLPQDVQTVLKEYSNKQTQKNHENNDKELFNKKVKELRDKIRAKASSEGKKASDLETEEYRAAMLDGMSDEQKKSRQEKIDAREKSLAARLGIISEQSVTDKDGTEKVIKESKDTKELIKERNPALFKALTDKYGKGK